MLQTRKNAIENERLHDEDEEKKEKLIFQILLLRKLITIKLSVF